MLVQYVRCGRPAARSLIARSRARAQTRDRVVHQRLVEVVDLDTLADPARERDRQLAAEVLAELAEPVEHDAPAAGGERERVVPARKAESHEQVARGGGGRAVAHA